VKLDAALPWLGRTVIVALLGAVAVLIATRTHWEEVTIPLPLRGEALTNPHYAQKVFLEAVGLNVETRQSLGVLPPQNGVVFVSAWHWDLIDSRKQALEEWVRNGGRLIVDDSLIDSLNSFADFSGINLEYPKYAEEEEEDESATDNQQVPMEVPGVNEKPQCIEWFVSVDLHGASGSRKTYNLCSAFSIGWLSTASKPMWAISDDKGYQAVRVQVGDGSVTAINAELFGNRDFKDIQRGALYVAAGQLRLGDSVWLLTETEYPSILTLVWRHGAPAVCLFGLFVLAAIWRNAVRFGPLRAPPIAARRSLAEQIRGTGWFILRVGGSRILYNAAVRSMREEAVRRISRFAQMTPEKQLDALVVRTGLDRYDLQQALFPISGHSRQQLYKAITLLESARRMLAQESIAQPASSGTKLSGTEKASHAN
jgi:hypothetical protein